MQAARMGGGSGSGCGPERGGVKLSLDVREGVRISQVVADDGPGKILLIGVGNEGRFVEQGRRNEHLRRQQDF